MTKSFKWSLSHQEIGSAQSPRQAVVGFDVRFDVDNSVSRAITHPTDRDFGCHETVLNDMEHDGTVLWAQNYETAALY